MGGPSPLLPTDPSGMGPYLLEGRLGGGGQGTVYLGDDGGGRRVAVKLLHAHLITDDTARARFLDEVELAKRVAPFCTAQVLDSGVLNGQPYIVSEYVDGPSLQSSVRESGGRGGAALERLALNTVTALSAIHRAGIVHRDFKPGNVLLGPDGPVVIDFGIARGLDLSRSLTGSQAIGTPGYTAPEFLRGDETGPAADLFAWGATMAYAATGRKAFDGTAVSAVMYAVLHTEPDLDGLDGRLAAVVRACLEKDPARRPTADEVGDHLHTRPAPAPPTSAFPLPAPADGGRERPSGREQSDGRGQAIGQERPNGWEQPDGWEEDGGQGRLSGGPEKRKRRGLVGVVIPAVLVVAGAAVLVLPGLRAKTPAEPPRSAPGAAVLETSDPLASREGEAVAMPGTRSPRPSGSPKGPGVTAAPGGTPKPKASTTPAAPATKKPATPKPSASSSEPAPSSPAPAQSPRTLGTVSSKTMGQYCAARGYPVHFYYNGTLTCQGNGSTTTGLTAVCLWLHPGEPGVRAEGTTCVSSP